MKLKIIEATNNDAAGNYGKFGVAVFHEEWHRRSHLDLGTRTPLLRTLGWGNRHIWVLDLQTGEGAVFQHGGYAPADLAKRKIWVCPLFRSFLEWLYRQDVTDLEALPDEIVLPDAPLHVFGARRAGVTHVIFEGRRRVLTGFRG